MFTRVVEVSTKPEKSHEVANTINEKVLPILRQQAGFLDVTVLTSDMEPNRVLALSFWKTKEDAERYQREHYAKVTEILSNLMECPPAVRTFNVHSSTPHKIAAGKALAQKCHDRVMSTLAQTRLANLTSLGSESRNQVSKMAESTEHWMQLARTASVEQDSRKQNDLPTDLILRLEEKGDQLNSPSDFDEVDKPRLAIYKQTAGIPIVGGCSACKDVVFDGRFVAGAAGERREKLENMFQEHCRGVHQSNDGLLKEKGRFGQALMNLQP